VISFRADRRLYVTADRSRVVEEGDPGAAFLLVGLNSIIEAEDVQRYGLTQAGGRAVLPEAENPAPAKSLAYEDKQVAPPEDKAAEEPPRRRRGRPAKTTEETP
jgi:hypothetical protein